MKLSVSEREEFFDAIYCGDCERVRQELARGVSPNLRSRLEDESALLYAASHGQDACIEVLLAYGADPNPLPMIEAALPKDTTVLKRFLAMGGAPSAPDAVGRTPLMEAANWGNTEAVQLLLDHGADPLVSVDANGTALDGAYSGKRINNPPGDYDGTIALLEAAMLAALHKAECKEEQGEPHEPRQ